MVVAAAAAAVAVVVPVLAQPSRKESKGYNSNPIKSNENRIRVNKVDEVKLS